MNNRITVEGMEAAIKAMDTLDDKMQKKTLIRVFKIAARPMVNDARSGARKYSKRVAKSIKVWEAKKAQFPMVLVAPKYTRDPNSDPWFSHMIEGGTKGVKKSKGSKNLPASTDTRLIHIRAALKNGRNGMNYRANQPARPFMAPAIERNFTKVNENIVTELGNFIEKTLK
jgi:HK97 gp10 family phage protein